MIQAIGTAVTKAQMVQTINVLPENTTVEDAIEQLVMLSGIREGLQ